MCYSCACDTVKNVNLSSKTVKTKKTAKRYFGREEDATFETNAFVLKRQ